MSKDLLTFDGRAAAVKATIAKYQGMPQLEKVEEGFISSDQIKANILTDVKAFVKQMEVLRAGSKDRQVVYVTLEYSVKWRIWRKRSN
jgi:hypothetical protein